MRGWGGEREGHVVLGQLITHNRWGGEGIHQCNSSRGGGGAFNNAHPGQSFAATIAAPCLLPPPPAPAHSTPPALLPP